MATVTDTLETLLQVKGAIGYIAEMTAAAKGTGLLAQAQAALAASSEVLAGALSLVGGRLAIVGAAIAAVIGVIGFSIKAFAESNDVVFRAALALRNMGSSLPIKELQDFANGLESLSGVDDSVIVTAGALLARFRVMGDQIPAALKAIVDMSLLTGKSVEEVSELFARGLMPNGSRALRQLGIQFASTGDRVKDTATLIKEFNKQAVGTTEARANTPLGAWQRAMKSIGSLFEALGRFFAPGMVYGMNQFIQLIDMITAKLNQLADILARYGLAAPSSPVIPGVQPGSKAALDAEGALDDNTAALKANTKAQEGIIRQAFGGPGTIGKAAGNIRALRGALGNASF